MMIGRQGHVTTTAVARSLAIVPLIGLEALIGLAVHRALGGAIIAAVAAACAQTLWLLWTVATGMTRHVQ